jgi:hypothetical protein
MLTESKQTLLDIVIFSIWSGLLTAQILKPCYVNCNFVTFKEQLLSQETQNISPDCGTITDFPLGPILEFFHDEYVHDSNDDHSLNYCTGK